MVVSGREILDDYQQIREVYTGLEETSEEYNLDELDESVEKIQDLLSDEPYTSVYQLIPPAVQGLKQAKSSVDSSDRIIISKMIDLLEEERKSYPAQTPERHYSSKRDQSNL
jgi:hypothetical protein